MRTVVVPVIAALAACKLSAASQALHDVQLDTIHKVCSDVVAHKKAKGGDGSGVSEVFLQVNGVHPKTKEPAYFIVAVQGDTGFCLPGNTDYQYPVSVIAAGVNVPGSLTCKGKGNNCSFSIDDTKLKSTMQGRPQADQDAIWAQYNDVLASATFGGISDCGRRMDAIRIPEGDVAASNALPAFDDRASLYPERASNGIPGHVGIIPDGSRRWSAARNLDDEAQYKVSARKMLEMLDACFEAGVHTVTLYASSVENVKNRGQQHMNINVAAVEKTLGSYYKEFAAKNVIAQLVTTPGNEDILSDSFQSLIKDVHATANEVKARAALTGDVVRTVNVLMNYGGREDAVKSAKEIATKVASGELKVEDIDYATLQNHMALPSSPDLIIRTAGEARLSNFPLLQSAYSEIYTAPMLWPDFEQDDLMAAFADYAERRKMVGA